MIPKFRGASISDNNKGQWMYGNLIIDGNYAYIVNGVIESNDQYITIAEWCPVAPITIGASTGLVDKNSKEIFEGDVVKLKYTVLSDYEFFKVTKFRGGSWRIDNRQRGSELWLRNEDCEIIGNIHQNPELVKGI
ncbi:YopX family protein [Streptococcus suis]